MENEVPFKDYDDPEIYKTSKARASDQGIYNFVVEFGRSNAQIAFNVEVGHVKSLIKRGRQPDRPVRWINLWGPHIQNDIVDLLGNHYNFSSRLLAIIKTEPPGARIKTQTRHSRTFKTKLHLRHVDVEAVSPKEEGFDSEDEKSVHGVPLEKAESPTIATSGVVSHYDLAEQMINYQSFDVGNRYISVGANFKHDVPSKIDSNNLNVFADKSQQRIWSWLILLDDHTILSIQEHPGFVKDERNLRSYRRNTISVLSQISNCVYGNIDAMSLQTVRQALDPKSSQTSQAVEGSSLLFYYLFDDWQAVYMNVARYSKRLQQFHDAIIYDLNKKSYQTPDVDIIPKLHLLGRLGRQSEHLYSGYKSLVERILASKPMDSQGELLISQSAYQRFERLVSRLELLIIAQMKESLAERDALVTTYFNINAQKDSESTARLTRSATLLAKLSVLFLPVSLMTSYFSIQINDLEGVYTAKDYWYSFAVIMSISFVALFFFSRLLMLVTETIDGWLKSVSHAFTMRLRKKRE